MTVAASVAKPVPDAARRWSGRRTSRTTERSWRRHIDLNLISMLKTTSLVVVIGYFELLTSVQRIYSTNFQTIPLLIVAALWYLALTSILSVGQYYVERYYGRGVAIGPQTAGLAGMLTRGAGGQ